MIAIQKEIVRDEHGDPQAVVIPWKQYRELMEELGQPVDDLPWSPEKLGEEAGKLADEKDPVKAQALRDRIVKGFYGDA